jgi:hypothetical protein
MQFGENIITNMLLISITFSQILNPIGENGMKIKIKVQRTTEKMYPFLSSCVPNAVDIFSIN